MNKCTANITDDVQCGYIEGNYVKQCDARECMPGFREYLTGNIEYDKIPFIYQLMMSGLFFMVLTSTIILVFSQSD